MTSTASKPAPRASSRSATPAASGPDALRDLSGKTLRTVAAGIGLTVQKDATTDSIVKAITAWAKHEDGGWERVAELAAGVNSAPKPARAAKNAPAAPAKGGKGKAPAAPPSTASRKPAAAPAKGERPGRESALVGKHLHKTDKGKSARRSDATRRTKNWNLISSGMKFETYLDRAEGGRGAGMADLATMIALGHIEAR